MSSYRYTIKTLNPLHIGTGEVMTALEYHIADQLIVPDLSRIFNKHPDTAASFSQKLAAKSSYDLSHTRLSQLLDASNFLIRDNRRYSMPGLHDKEVNFHTLNKLDKQIGQGNGDIRIATKTPGYSPYIPGSSIKGALKTAWVYKQCLTDKPTATTIINSEANDGLVRSQIFQPPSERNDMAFDIFRLAAIGDSEPRNPEDTLLLVGERVLSANIRARDGEAKALGEAAAQYKNYWTFCEAIDSEMEFNGRIRFDRKLLDNQNSQRMMGWTDTQRSLSMESLREASNCFAADLCQWEIEYFERISQQEGRCDVEDVLGFYYEMRDDIASAPENVLYCSLGHGSGWHKLTIGLLLEKQLSKEQFIRFRRNKNLADRYTDFEYPKSRKLIMSNETRADSPFGWVKLSFILETGSS